MEASSWTKESCHGSRGYGGPQWMLLNFYTGINREKSYKIFWKFKKMNVVQIILIKCISRLLQFKHKFGERGLILCQNGGGGYSTLYKWFFCKKKKQSFSFKGHYKLCWTFILMKIQLLHEFILFCEHFEFISKMCISHTVF